LRPRITFLHLYLKCSHAASVTEDSDSAEEDVKPAILSPPEEEKEKEALSGSSPSPEAAADTGDKDLLG